MTDCDKLMEQKDLPKVVYRKRHAKREKARGKKQNRVVKAFFQSLCAASLMHTHVSSVIEYGHLPHPVRPLNCCFQQPSPDQEQGRVLSHDCFHRKYPPQLAETPGGQKH